ncbi:MAG: UDP-N-acetylglucosamine 1-carboxyvinyltransferase, partial [Acidobacteriota bacterium]
MQKLRIIGGHRLRGEVPTGGAKNAALPALVATLMCNDELRLSNVPDVRDVGTICRLLQHLGVEVQRPAPGEVITKVHSLECCDAPYELVKTMRASFLVLGPMLARTGRARVSLPGGCAIGARPVDRHLAAFTSLGADIRVEHGYVVAEA